MKNIILSLTCAAWLSTGLAATTTATNIGTIGNFKVESLSILNYAINLLDDGRLLALAQPVYTYSSSCTGECNTPTLTYQGLLIMSPGQTPRELPGDFKGRAIFSTHDTRLLSWPSSNMTLADFSWLDVDTLSSATFATGGLPPASGTCASWEGMWSFSYSWLALSDKGTLVMRPSKETCFHTGDPAQDALYPDSIFLWSGASTQEIRPPKGYSSIGFGGINASNTVAGSVVTNNLFGKATSAGRPFVWSQAKGHQILSMPILSTLAGYVSAEATSINDQGDVLGNMYTRKGVSRAVIWRANKPTDIGTLPSYEQSRAVGLTSTGQVLACAMGPSSSSLPSLALFLWSQGTRQPLILGNSSQPLSCTEFDRFKTNRRGQWLLQNSQYQANAQTYLFSPLK